jgi:hypothetical protein
MDNADGRGRRVAQQRFSERLQRIRALDFCAKRPPDQAEPLTAALDLMRLPLPSGTEHSNHEPLGGKASEQVRCGAMVVVAGDGDHLDLALGKPPDAAFEGRTCFEVPVAGVNEIATDDDRCHPVSDR